MSLVSASLVRRVAGVLFATALVASGCGSDSEEGSGGDNECYSFDEPTTEGTYDGSDPSADIAERGEPTDIWAPDEPLTELKVIDVVEGSGATVGARVDRGGAVRRDPAE